MKAILLKELDGLNVGETYDINIDSDVEGIGKQFAVWQEFSSRMPLVKEYDSLSDVFDDWFVLQELPETITQHIEKIFEEGSARSIAAGHNFSVGALTKSKAKDRLYEINAAAVSAVKNLLAGVEEIDR